MSCKKNEMICFRPRGGSIGARHEIAVAMHKTMGMCYDTARQAVDGRRHIRCRPDQYGRLAVELTHKTSECGPDIRLFEPRFEELPEVLDVSDRRAGG